MKKFIEFIIEFLIKIFKSKIGNPEPIIDTPESKKPIEPIKIVNPEPSETEKGGLFDGSTTEKPNFIHLWKICKLDEDKLKEVERIGNKIMSHKSRYEVIQKATGVPWMLIGSLHQMESDLDFNTCLHNGDKLPGPTINVPAGRGPFKDWEEAAIDALGMKNKIYAPNGIWTYAYMLEFSEKFNGFGYRSKGIYSPYVWAFTNISDEKGRYIRDHVFDRESMHKRPGVAALIYFLSNNLKPT